MLATDFTNFVKGEMFNGLMESFLGTGVFNSDGKFIFLSLEFSL
jgi:hypothetical protein